MSFCFWRKNQRISFKNKRLYHLKIINLLINAILVPKFKKKILIYFYEFYLKEYYLMQTKQTEEMREELEKEAETSAQWKQKYLDLQNSLAMPKPNAKNEIRENGKKKLEPLANSKKNEFKTEIDEELGSNIEEPKAEIKKESPKKEKIIEESEKTERSMENKKPNNK